MTDIKDEDFQHLKSNVDIISKSVEKDQRDIDKLVVISENQQRSIDDMLSALIGNEVSGKETGVIYRLSKVERSVERLAFISKMLGIGFIMLGGVKILEVFGISLSSLL